MALSGLLKGRTDWRDQSEIKGELGQHRTELLAERVAELEERVDKLALLSMALWTLLKKQTDWDDEELLKQVTALDLQDGKLDGQVQNAVTECPACHRPVSRRHRHCLYCEQELTSTGGAFEGVVR
jgi:hypothetical protein